MGRRTPPNLVEGCKALVVLGNVCHHRALIRLDAVDHVWAHRNKHAHKVEEEEEGGGGEEERGGACEKQLRLAGWMARTTSQQQIETKHGRRSESLRTFSIEQLWDSELALCNVKGRVEVLARVALRGRREG